MILILTVSLAGCRRAFDAYQRDLPALEPPSAHSAAEVADVDRIAIAYWVRNRGLMAIECSQVEGCFKVRRSIEGFATAGDIVWEVRMRILGEGPTGLLWINPRTKKVQVLGLGNEPPNQAPVPPVAHL